MTSRRWLLTISAASTLVAIACSSDPPQDDDTTQTGTTTGSTQTGTTSGSTSTGTSTGSTSTGSALCDRGDCDTCTKSNCALVACAEQLNLCLANPDCVDLSVCWSNCTDEACLEACDQQHPDGVADQHGLYECQVCTACPVDCEGSLACD